MNDRRGFFRKGLHPLYQIYYDALCALLPDSWQPTCGIRTFDQQAKLFAQGRSGNPGKIVTKAQAGMSYHNYGLASDWDWFPGNIYSPLKADDPKWKDYIDACQKVGLDNINWEKPHNQMRISTPISGLLEAYQQGGMKAVNALLQTEPGSHPVSEH